MAYQQSEMEGVRLRPIGHVESSLVERESAPRQGDEGAPQAWVVIDPAVREGMSHITVGEEILLLTWLHRANRDVLSVHPRGDPERALTGVFSTRSPDRPNPIGLHRVHVLEIRPDRILVDGLEALDGTPVVDIKPVLDASER